MSEQKKIIIIDPNPKTGTEAAGFYPQTSPDIETGKKCGGGCPNYEKDNCEKLDRVFSKTVEDILTERQQFLLYLETTRQEFSDLIRPEWLEVSVKKRVAIENLLIAYDQAAERLKEIYKG